MLSEKIARRLVYKTISAILVCAMILNELSFAAAEPNHHLSPPSKFNPIAESNQNSSFLEKAAFRDISILIGKYLRIGISEYTLKKHVKQHLAGLQKAVEGDPILKGFAFGEITYDDKENSFLLPRYINNIKTHAFKYYLHGNPKEADMVIPLGDETDVLVKVQAIGDKNLKNAPAGSIPGLFDYLCKQNRPLGAKDIAAGLGRSYETIKYDARALYYHLRLIDKADARLKGKEARYYVPESVKNKASAITPVLSLFAKEDLRPSRPCLELANELFIRPLFAPTAVSQKDGSVFARIKKKTEAYYLEIARYIASMENGEWLKSPAAFARRIGTYEKMAERFSSAGAGDSQDYIQLNNMIVRMEKDLGAIRFKAERFLQNGEFDALFRPIRGREAELSELPLTDERSQELKELFKAVIDRLETHVLVEIENRIDGQYIYADGRELKVRLAHLSDTIEMMQNNLPNIDIEDNLKNQFLLAKRAEEFLQDIKTRLYVADMRGLANALLLNHDLEFGGTEVTEDPAQKYAQAIARRLLPDELSAFMCAIENLTPDKKPTKGSEEERLTEFTRLQLAVMLNMRELSWNKIEKLSGLATREWEKLGSNRRMWADETTKTIRVYYKKHENGWGKIPALARLVDAIGSR